MYSKDVPKVFTKPMMGRTGGPPGPILKIVEKLIPSETLLLVSPLLGHFLYSLKVSVH